MTKQINNELAYPFKEEAHYGNPMQQHLGLTKREAFAMAAMQGTISNNEWFKALALQSKEEQIPIEKGIAITSVAFADALLEALSNDT